MEEYEAEFENQFSCMLYLVHLPYDEAKKQNVDLFEFASDDEILSEYIDRETTIGNLKHLEIFKRKKNVIATELGYYMSVYETELSYPDDDEYKIENLD